MKIPFNVNDYVWVKLTPVGLKILERNFYELRRAFPNLPKQFTPPLMDDEGYTKYQMWSLMNDFGNYMVMGGQSPFETDVIFETKENS